MARIRTIKPELTRDRRLAEVPPEVRWTFTALLCHVDDEGRCEDEPRLIKADLYPYDDVTAADVDKHLGQLAECAQVLCRYEVAGRRYMHILDFRDDGLEAGQRGPWGQRPQKPYPSRWPSCGLDHEQFGAQGTLFDTAGQSPNGHGSPTDRIPVREKAAPMDHGPWTMDHGPEAMDHVHAQPVPASKQLAPAQLAAAFAAFWGVYPRKEGKRRAQAEFTLALQRTDLGTLLAGVTAYRDRPGRVSKYTKHPSTWLHQDCWDDDPDVQPGPPALEASRGDQRMQEHLAAKAARAQRRGQGHGDAG